MKKVIALRHIHFEDLGTFEDVLQQRGFAVDYRNAATGDLAFDALVPELLVVLGGPIGAYEDATYPFIRDEIALLKKRLAKDLPVLGICLGAQMMARALGARVYPGPQKEIGWKPLTPTEAGKNSFFKALAPEYTSMLHWHGDTFDLPKDATLLASTDICKHQAFTWGRGGLGFQFHPEVRGTNIENWLVGHACELAGAKIDVSKLRQDTRRLVPALEKQGRACFTAWLDQLGL